MAEAISGRPINVNIVDKMHLYKSWMPFIDGGALFVQQDEINVDFGNKVFILLSLPGEKIKKTISGKVVWVSNNTPNKGFGVTLGEGAQSKMMKDLIESIIADVQKQDVINFTI